MSFEDLTEFLKLSSALNYNLSAASVNRYNVLMFIIGDKRLAEDDTRDREHKSILMEALAYLFEALPRQTPASGAHGGAPSTAHGGRSWRIPWRRWTWSTCCRSCSTMCSKISSPWTFGRCAGRSSKAACSPCSSAWCPKTSGA